MKDEWLALKDAVQRIAGRLDGESDKARERLAASALYDEFRRGHVRSRAGRVYAADGPGSTWSLANWPIPAALWQVTTVYQWSKNYSVSWSYPVNEPKPDGWPAGSVKLSEIELSCADIDHVWPLPKVAGARISHKELVKFLSGIADGTKTEAECREAAKVRFGLKSIPEKNIWRPAWKQVPSSQKAPLGRPRKSGK
jgi:hypothetical protein